MLGERLSPGGFFAELGDQTMGHTGPRIAPASRTPNLRPHLLHPSAARGPRVSRTVTHTQ